MNPRHVPASWIAASLAAIATLLAGCMSYPVDVSVRRESVPAPSARTYFLDNLTTDLLRQDRHFGPALTCLRTAMIHRGFIEVARREEAALIVEFDYGVAAAGVEKSFRPVHNDTAPREIVSLATGRVVTIIPRSAVGVTTSVEPRYTVWVRIIGEDAGTHREVWSVVTHAEIGAADHNNILPCLIAAAEPNLEPATTAQLVASIGQESSEVKALRAGR
jgi:hypothetical protein